MTIEITSRGLNTIDRVMNEVDALCEALRKAGYVEASHDTLGQAWAIYYDESESVPWRVAELRELKESALLMVLEFTNFFVVVNSDTLIITDDLNALV